MLVQQRISTIVVRFCFLSGTAPKNYDVIIVGGGLAGLGAADAIETANTVLPQPVTWCIMEAHD